MIKAIPDEYGFCCRCHKNLVTERVVEGVIKKWFLPDYGQLQLRLDDGSLMRVVMCLPCQEKYQDTEKENNEIMECIKLGWEKEIDELLKWDSKKKDDYMKVYSKLKIKNKVKEFTHGIVH